MPKQYRKELSFQAGEISPLFFGRSETEFYDKGLALAENVFIDKRGGAFRRQGLEHIGQLDGNDARVFTKQIHRFRFDTIILTDLIATIIAPGAGFSSPNLLDNGTFADEGASWTVIKTPASSVVSFSTGACLLLPETEDTELVSNANFNQGSVAWSVTLNGGQSDITFSNNSCVMTVGSNVNHFARLFQSVVTADPNVEHQLDLSGILSLSPLDLKIGTGEDDGTYLDIAVTDFSDVILFTPTASPFTITIQLQGGVAGFVTLFEVSVPDAGEKTAAISQEATVTGSQSATHVVIVEQQGQNQLNIKIGSALGLSDIASFVVGDDFNVVEFVPNAASFFATVESDGDDSFGSSLIFVGAIIESDVGGIGLSQVAPWTEEQLPEVHIIESPDGEVMYFTHPNVTTYRLSYDFATDTYGALQAVSFTSAPSVWTGTNFPATGTFFQGRLWLAGTPNEPQTFWASVSGAPEDFTVTGGQDSSSLEFTLQKFGRIQWMLGTRELLLGTENGEHIVESDGPVITPTDFDIQQQSAYGSNAMQSIQVGEQVFYMTPDGRRLQAMSYARDENNWLSQDLTFAAEHITEGIAKHRAWLQNPGALYMVTLENGEIANLTYDRTSQTVGWSRFVAEGFRVHDIAGGLENGISHIVLVGRRTAGKVDVEISGSNDQFLDSYVSVFDDATTDVITGLDHLEGETVQILVDGAVNPSEVVVGGQVTADTTGTRLFAGKQIISKVVTLPPDVPGSSIRSWKKRWNKVWALLNQSNAPIINGVRPPDRTPSTPMDTAEPVTSGHFKTVNLGWDDFGQVTIEEDLPVPMNLLAIYGEMGAETL